MNTLRQLANDLAQAAVAITGEAEQVVHTGARSAEVQVRQFDGTSTEAAVTFPAPLSAHIQGTETFGVSQETSPLSALNAVDVGEIAKTMADQLAAAGAKLIMGHR